MLARGNGLHGLWVASGQSCQRRARVWPASIENAY